MNDSGSQSLDFFGRRTVNKTIARNWSLFFCVLIILLCQKGDSEVPSTMTSNKINEIKSELAGKYKNKPVELRLDERGPLCKRIEALLFKQAAYLISTLEPWEKIPGALTLTSMKSGEHSIRPNAHTTLGLAIMYRTISEGYPEGISPEICRDKAIGILRCILSCHGAGNMACGDGKKWHNQWQSALWAASSGMAAWLLWDDLDPELQWLAARMICDEADRFMDKTPPTQIENDTKAEENAWNSKVIALAYNMFPNHPHHEAYGEAVLRWAISSYARESDAKSEEILDGRTLNKWLTGGNAHEDYTVENHGIVHPDYMNACDQCIYLTLMYDWAGQIPPKGILFNTDKVYANLKIFSFPDEGYIYPNGQDWRIHRNPDWIRIHTAQSVLFGDSQAATLLRLGLDTTERMTARNSQGGIYIQGEWFFPSAHHMYFECLSGAYLLMGSRGEGAAPLTEEQLWESLSGRYIFMSGRLGILRTPKSIATFSWGRRIMGMTLPLQKDLLLTPYQLGLVGSINVDGVKKEYPKIKQIEIQDSSDWLGICGILERAGGVISQRFGFLALPDGRTIYTDLIEKKGDAKIISLELGSLGILNEPGWVFHNGKRTLYNKNGEKVFSSHGDEESPVDLNSPWYNIDEELGIICISDSGNQRYIPNKKSVRGRVEQLLHLNYIEKPKRFPINTVLILYPGRNTEETQKASEKCKITKPDSSIYNLILEDGKKITFNLENLSIKEE